MESEKVKEIKELLLRKAKEYESQTLLDILTLINELESENKRLKIQLAQANAGIVNCSGCKLVEINAVREFVEKLKECAKSCEESGYDGIGEDDIDLILKEYEELWKIIT